MLLIKLVKVRETRSCLIGALSLSGSLRKQRQFKAHCKSNLFSTYIETLSSFRPFDIFSELTMKHSPFSKLSPELRNRIYEYALKSDKPFDITTTAPCGKPRNKMSYIQGNPLALATTCRVIKNECTQLFYANNTFKVTGDDTDHVFELLDKFCTTIGQANVDALGMIVLDIGTLLCALFESYRYVKALAYFHVRSARLAFDDGWSSRLRMRVNLVPENDVYFDFHDVEGPIIVNFKGHEQSQDANLALMEKKYKDENYQGVLDVFGEMLQIRWNARQKSECA